VRDKERRKCERKEDEGEGVEAECNDVNEMQLRMCCGDEDCLCGGAERSLESVEGSKECGPGVFEQRADRRGKERSGKERGQSGSYI